MKSQQLKLKQLDRQIEDWEAIKQKYKHPPRSGWIKTLRKAFGMTAEQLGLRLGVTRGRIVQLEKAEIEDAITLRTLKKAATAMDCELIYAIVPKKYFHKNPLENIIQMKAKKIAKKMVRGVSHSMSLENQSIDKKQEEEQIKELTQKLLEGSHKKLWQNK